MNLEERGRRGVALSGYLLPLRGGELAREEEGHAATAFVGRRTGIW